MTKKQEDRLNAGLSFCHTNKIPNPDSTIHNASSVYNDEKGFWFWGSGFSGFGFRLGKERFFFFLKFINEIQRKSWVSGVEAVRVRFAACRGGSVCQSFRFLYYLVWAFALSPRVLLFVYLFIYFGFIQKSPLYITTKNKIMHNTNLSQKNNISLYNLIF